MSKSNGPDSSLPSQKTGQQSNSLPNKKKFSTKSEPVLVATTKSWQKNSFGLFDYECQEFQKSHFRLEQTGKVVRYEKPKPEDRKNLIVNIEAQHEDLDSKETKNKPGNESQVARLLRQDGGFWIYHKNKVDLSTLFSQPEEKLWLVVQNYQGGLGQNQNNLVRGKNNNDDESVSQGLKRGFKLEKNSVIKFGRVRLRVRDIDYPYAQNQQQVIPVQQDQEFKVESAKYDSATGTRRDAYASGPNFLDVPLDDVNPAAFKTDFTNLNGLIIDEHGRNVSPKNKKILTNKKGQRIDAEFNDIRGRTKLTEESEPVCRICWGTENEDLQNAHKDGVDPDDFNPLISPCKCSGTMGLIHLKCLRGWLETKRTRKEHKKQVIYKFKKLDCELCKQNFPFKITYNNRIVDIVGVDKPKKNYIVLESLSSETQKIFYVINTEDIEPVSQLTPAGQELKRTQAVKIGRGQDSDVRVTDDISVSRNHAYIQKTQNGDYYLVDNNSKFGTLVLVQYPIFLSPKLLNNNPLVLQSGKTCISINVRQTKTCADNRLACCFRNLFRKSSGQKPKLATLDGVSYFPEVFIDKTASKSGVKVCNDSQEDEEEYRAEPSGQASQRGRSPPRSDIAQVPTQNNHENREAALLTTNRNNRNQVILQSQSPSASHLQIGNPARLIGDDSVREHTLLQPRNNPNFHMSRLNNSNQNQDNSPRSPGRLLQRVQLQVDQSFSQAQPSHFSSRRRKTQHDFYDRMSVGQVRPNGKRAISVDQGIDDYRLYGDFSMSVNELNSFHQEHNLLSENQFAHHYLQEYLGLDYEADDSDPFSRSLNNRFQHNLFNAVPIEEQKPSDQQEPPIIQSKRHRKARRSHLVHAQNSSIYNSRAQAPLPVLPNIGFTQRSVPQSDFSISPVNERVKCSTTQQKKEQVPEKESKVRKSGSYSNQARTRNQFTLTKPKGTIQHNILDNNSATFDLLINNANKTQQRNNKSLKDDLQINQVHLGPPNIDTVPEEYKPDSLIEPIESQINVNPEKKESLKLGSISDLQQYQFQRSMSFGMNEEISVRAQSGGHNVIEEEQPVQNQLNVSRLSSDELRNSVAMYQGYRSHSILQRESQMHSLEGSESISGKGPVEDL